MSLLPVLILTYFEPFGGRAENQSERLAVELQSRIEQAGVFSEVRLCRTPVVYDLAPRIAFDCIQTFQTLGRPVWVMSLGEFPGNELRIETAAHNWDATPHLPDNSGATRNGSEIIPGAERSLGFRFPMTDFFKSPLLRAQKPLISASPGEFLCNHLSYHLTRVLSEQDVPYLFVHTGINSYPTPVSEALTEALSFAVRSSLPIKRNPTTLREVLQELENANSDADAQWWLAQLKAEIQK